MPPTANMAITKPTVGGSSGTWGTELNTAIDLIDVHDHTSGKGVQVPSAGLNINADLSFGNNAATNLKAARFAGTATITSFTKGLTVKSSDNELYWVTNAGAEVKITSGTGLNVSGTGGIEGDYITTDAQIAYVNADTLYTVKSDDAPSTWAGIDAGDIGLYEKAGGITTKVRLKSPSTLAASYDWVFPTALPAATSVLTLSSAGQVAATLTPSVTSLTVTDPEIKHGARTIVLPASAAQFSNSPNNYWVPIGFATPGGYWGSFTGGGVQYADVPLSPHVILNDRIISLTVHLREGSAAGEEVVAKLFKISAAGVRTQVSTTKTSGTSNGDATVFWTTADADFAASGYTVEGGQLVVNVEIPQTSAAAECRLYQVSLSFDRP